MFEISIDTLRYYDKIGILKPEVNKDNNYRIYSFKDIYLLSAILGARYLEVPIKEIQEHLNRESLDFEEYLSFMEKQEKILKDKIKHIEKIKDSVIESKENILRVKNLKNNYDLESIKGEVLKKYFYKIPIKELIQTGYCKRLNKVLEIKNKKFDYFKLFYFMNGSLKMEEKYLYVEKNDKSDKVLATIRRLTKINFEYIQLNAKIVSIEFLGTEKEIKDYIISIFNFNKKNKGEIFLKTISYFSTKKDDYGFIEAFII